MSRYLKAFHCLLFCLIIFASPGLWAAETREVLDSNGQKVIIPLKVTKVAPLIPAFAQMTEMLTLGSGKIVAYPRVAIGDFFKHVFPDIEKSAPIHDSGSVEAIIASGAQVAFGPDLRLSDEQRAQLQEAGIAVVATNGIYDVAGLSQSFLIIGNILGETEAQRAREFVEYYQGNIKEAQRRSQNLKEEKRIKLLVLYAGGGTYRTINHQDISHEYLVAAGGLNVAANLTGPSPMALNVDPEQIIVWNPDIIMTNSQTGKQDILDNPSLSEVAAIKSKKVYVCPYGIFQWSVRSGEGAMLPLWLGKIMYPELYSDIDMKKVVRDFFHQYYNYETTEEELDTILAGAR